MRTCVWCDGPLPETEHKGHRRREFCSDSCKQKHYLWHKKMKHDAGILAEPYWKFKYFEIVSQCKWLEEKLQDRVNDLKKEREYTDSLERDVQHYIKKAEAIQADCVARMRAVGMSEEDIREFNAYWDEHTKHYWPDII